MEKSGGGDLGGGEKFKKSSSRRSSEPATITYASRLDRKKRTRLTAPTDSDSVQNRPPVLRRVDTARRSYDFSVLSPSFASMLTHKQQWRRARFPRHRLPISSENTNDPERKYERDSSPIPSSRLRCATPAAPVANVMAVIATPCDTPTSTALVLQKCSGDGVELRKQLQEPQQCKQDEEEAQQQQPLPLSQQEQQQQEREKEEEEEEVGETDDQEVVFVVQDVVTCCDDFRSDFATADPNEPLGNDANKHSIASPHSPSSSPPETPPRSLRSALSSTNLLIYGPKQHPDPRILRFSPKIHVVLIQDRSELKDMIETLFWRHHDYQKFKLEAVHEIKETACCYKMQPRAAMNFLYQPDRNLLPISKSAYEVCFFDSDEDLTSSSMFFMPDSLGWLENNPSLPRLSYSRHRSSSADSTFSSSSSSSSSSSDSDSDDEKHAVATKTDSSDTQAIPKTCASEKSWRRLETSEDSSDDEIASAFLHSTSTSSTSSTSSDTSLPYSHYSQDSLNHRGFHRLDREDVSEDKVMSLRESQSSSNGWFFHW